MKKSYDKAFIETCLKQTKFESIRNSLQKHLFLTQYQKGEFVTTPLQEEHLFQIIVQGTVSIYFIGDDGSVYSLVLIYMKYKCNKGELKGLQQAAFHLNCSARQLQRILNQYESDGIVIKTGKGTYKLTVSGTIV